MYRWIISVAAALPLMTACGGGDEAAAFTAPYTNNFDGANPLNSWIFHDPYASNASKTPPSGSIRTLWGVRETPAAMPGNPAYSAPKSLSYNNGTNYDTGAKNGGDAMSPKINISAMTTPVLFFRCNYQTDTDGVATDRRTIGIGYFDDKWNPHYHLRGQFSTNPGDAVVGQCAASGTWHHHMIPLNKAWGTIRIGFTFNTMDAANNAKCGWFIDDFKVVEQGSLGQQPGATTTLHGIYTSAFDTAADAQGWTLGNSGAVAWAIDSAPATMPGGVARSGSSSLNYNDGVDYDNGSSNTAVAESPEISIKNFSEVKLKFWCNYKTQSTYPGWDRRVVKVFKSGDSSPVLDAELAGQYGSTLVNACSAMGVWHAHEIALDATWDKIKIQFLFDTVDANNNTHPGWFIDDLTVDGGAVEGQVQGSVEGDGGGDDDDDDDDKCGMLGIEVLVVLGLLALARAGARKVRIS